MSEPVCDVFENQDAFTSSVESLSNQIVYSILGEVTRRDVDGSQQSNPTSLQDQLSARYVSLANRFQFNIIK